MIQLRPYQEDIIERGRQALRRFRRVLLQAPTGAGKTALATFIAGESARNGRRVWFICHRKELVAQTSLTFLKFGIRHSFIAAGRPFDARAQVFICSIDTLKTRIHLLEPGDLVIWDECHHIGADGWAGVMERLVKARHIGLSATPMRVDGKGLDAFFDEMVLGPSPSWLMDQGFLSRYQLFAPPAPKELKTRGGDDGLGAQARVLDKPKLTGDVISHWLRLANGMRTVAFACNVQHSRHMAEQFTAAGIPAAHLDGGAPTTERDRIIQRYASGELLVLSNVSLFGEGFDLSAIAQRDVTIDCVIQNRKTDSLPLHLQQVGRALRPAPGKVAVIMDHADNCRQHGYPDDEREWTLRGREGGGNGKGPQDGPPPPIICESCFMGIPRPLPLLCPHCGKALRQPGREIEVAEGELEEQTPEHRRQLRAMQQMQEELACRDGLGALVILACRRGLANPQQWALEKLAAWNESRRARATVNT